MTESALEIQDKQYIKMTETPVEKLVATLAVPTVISMMVTNVYNVVDTAFVGTLGNSASGAVGVVFGHTEAWLILIGTAIIGMLSYYMWYKSIRSIGAPRAVCLNVTYSFWSVLFGALLFHIRMTSYDYVGALLVLVGVCIATVYTNKKRRKRLDTPVY